MKTVILYGGMGASLSEETGLRSKPMVEIGGRPILWHTMQHYAKYKLRNFTLALGYKGEVTLLQHVVSGAVSYTHLTLPTILLV